MFLSVWNMLQQNHPAKLSFMYIYKILAAYFTGKGAGSVEKKKIKLKN